MAETLFQKQVQWVLLYKHSRIDRCESVYTDASIYSHAIIFKGDVVSGIALSKDNFF